MGFAILFFICWVPVECRVRGILGHLILIVPSVRGRGDAKDWQHCWDEQGQDGVAFCDKFPSSVLTTHAHGGGGGGEQGNGRTGSEIFTRT